MGSADGGTRVDDKLAELEKRVIVDKITDLDAIARSVVALDTEFAASCLPLPTCRLSLIEACVKEQLNDVVHMLLDKKLGKVDQCVGYTCTPLCKTCYSSASNIGMIKILLFFGSNPNATISNDSSGASCLISSVINRNRDAVELLLKYGADVGYSWKGQNALSMAIDFRYTDIAEVIESHEMSKAQANRERAIAAKRPRHPQPPKSPEPSIDFDRTLEKQSILTTSFLSDIQQVDWLYSRQDVVIGATLGTGGFGNVHKATLRATGDHIACKIIQCGNEAQLRSYKQELVLMSRFRHENIVLFLGAVLDLPQLCILTELMKWNLFDRLRSLPSVPIPWPTRLKWCRDISKAMNYLHTRAPPVIHRDLKSMNVLLDDYDRVKLCDFGLSKRNQSIMASTGDHITGSPAWMAPETLRGEDYTVSSDVYSFSVILWEVLLRRPPWPGKTLPQLVGLVGFSQSHLEIPPPEGRPADTPPAYLDLLLRCQAAAADQRPTFRELVGALAALLRRVDEQCTNDRVLEAQRKQFRSAQKSGSHDLE
eukprot:TRINITY_DN877_c0_g1_i1.p1 TRINITY_DN877_c0_g1~~TRINITY_DN877_c0_g1_i1.p1  ORF type:complete len:539 (+),score=170.75 TRINITY_DN877_c0_g1_i1:96-1712(+)